MPAAGILGRKGANLRDLFCTTPEVLKFAENYFGIYKKYWAKKIPEGTHQVATSLGARPTPLGRPCGLWAPWQASGAHLLLYGGF